jgi:hypothetical protein
MSGVVLPFPTRGLQSRTVRALLEWLPHAIHEQKSLLALRAGLFRVGQILRQRVVLKKDVAIWAAHAVKVENSLIAR